MQEGRKKGHKSVEENVNLESEGSRPPARSKPSIEDSQCCPDYSHDCSCCQHMWKGIRVERRTEAKTWVE